MSQSYVTLTRARTTQKREGVLPSRSFSEGVELDLSAADTDRMDCSMEQESDRPCFGFLDSIDDQSVCTEIFRSETEVRHFLLQSAKGNQNARDGCCQQDVLTSFLRDSLIVWLLVYLMTDTCS